MFFHNTSNVMSHGVLFAFTFTCFSRRLANGKVSNGFCFKKHCYEFRDSLLHEPERYSVKAEFRVGA